MKNTKMVISHSDKDGSVNAEAIVTCPNCGERYRYESPYAYEPGEKFMQFCDGEEGCGEEFSITVR